MGLRIREAALTYPISTRPAPIPQHSPDGSTGMSLTSGSPTLGAAISLKGSIAAAGHPGEFSHTSASDVAPRVPTTPALDEKQLWKKVDLRLIPLVTIMYVAAFIDRTNIGMLLLYEVIDIRLTISGHRQRKDTRLDVSVSSDG